MNDLRPYALQILQSTLELCVLTIKNASILNQNNPLLMSIWSEQETADLVDYLYLCRGEIIEGSFPPGTFNNLAVYLNRRYPGSDRSHKSVLSKFGTVRTSLFSLQRLTQALRSSRMTSLSLTDTMQSTAEGQILPLYSLLMKGDSLVISPLLPLG